MATWKLHFYWSIIQDAQCHWKFCDVMIPIVMIPIMIKWLLTVKYLWLFSDEDTLMYISYLTVIMDPDIRLKSLTKLMASCDQTLASTCVQLHKLAMDPFPSSLVSRYSDHLARTLTYLCNYESKMVATCTGLQTAKTHVSNDSYVWVKKPISRGNDVMINQVPIILCCEDSHVRFKSLEYIDLPCQHSLSVLLISKVKNESSDVKEHGSNICLPMSFSNPCHFTTSVYTVPGSGNT
jgi:hypothetical protein